MAAIKQWELAVLIVVLVFIGLLLFGPAPIKERCQSVLDSIIRIIYNPDSNKDGQNFGEMLKENLLDSDR